MIKILISLTTTSRYFESPSTPVFFSLSSLRDNRLSLFCIKEFYIVTIFCNLFQTVQDLSLFIRKMGSKDLEFLYRHTSSLWWFMCLWKTIIKVKSLYLVRILKYYPWKLSSYLLTVLRNEYLHLDCQVIVLSYLWTQESKWITLRWVSCLFWFLYKLPRL